MNIQATKIKEGSAGKITQWLRVPASLAEDPGPRFGPQNPHGNSQLSVTPVSWDLTPMASGTRYTCGTHAYM